MDQTAAGALLSHTYNTREAFAILKGSLMRQEVVCNIQWFRGLLSNRLLVEHVKESVQRGFLSPRGLRGSCELSFGRRCFWRRVDGRRRSESGD